jgi:hypothetical protein
MDWNERLKLFAMNNQLIEHSLDAVEREFAVEIRASRSTVATQDESYYPQIERAYRAEAARMAPNYEIIYSLEKTIRSLIGDTIETADGSDWWDKGRVPPKIMQDSKDRRKRELDSGVTPRSADLIDFTTFGELSEIIKANWDLFGSIFSSQKAVEKVMASLNTLRGPIAHCSPLAEDEIVRLKLAVRDWFRLME